MVNLSVRADGMERVMSHLDVVAKNVSAAIDDAAREGAGLVQARAKALAPKKSGRLRRSIRTRRGRYGITRLVRPRSGIAHMQEYGTKKVQPRRFMQQAREEILPGVQRKILEAVERAVRKQMELRAINKAIFERLEDCREGYIKLNLKIYKQGL